MRRTLGPHSAAASIPRRLILLDAEVLARRGEFERTGHEPFHFARASLECKTLELGGAEGKLPPHAGRAWLELGVA
jgi:hypothetical protein